MQDQDVQSDVLSHLLWLSVLVRVAISEWYSDGDTDGFADANSFADTDGE
jgi:hypothetical protein